jgi:hypothetical protein
MPNPSHISPWKIAENVKGHYRIDYFLLAPGIKVAFRVPLAVVALCFLR